MLKAVDAVVDRILTVYEALIRMQEHFLRIPSISGPHYFGCALKLHSSPECSFKERGIGRFYLVISYLGLLVFIIYSTLLIMWA